MLKNNFYGEWCCFKVYIIKQKTTEIKVKIRIIYFLNQSARLAEQIISHVWLFLVVNLMFLTTHLAPNVVIFHTIASDAILNSQILREYIA